VDRVNRALGLSFLPLLCTPAIARACPVCFAARDEAERIALLGTTVFLTALPVIMVGGIIYWIAKRSRELDEDQAAPPAELQDSARSSDKNASGAAGLVTTQAEVLPLRRA
jgi:hypothetical protein